MTLAREFRGYQIGIVERAWLLGTDRRIGDQIVWHGARIIVGVVIGCAILAGGTIFAHLLSTLVRELFADGAHAIGTSATEVTTFGDLLKLLFAAHSAREGLVVAALALTLLLTLLFASATFLVAVAVSHRIFWTLKGFFHEPPPPLDVSLGGLKFADAGLRPSEQTGREAKVSADPLSLDGTSVDIGDILWAQDERMVALELKLEALHEQLKRQDNS